MRLTVLLCIIVTINILCYGQETRYFENKLRISNTYVKDSLRCIDFQTLPEKDVKNTTKIKTASPLITRLWNIALADIESNIVENDGNSYFGAGRSFGMIVYTRDISFAGILGLNKLYPEIMFQSLKFTRDVRLKLGFHVSRGHAARTINADWREDSIPENSFLKKFNTNSYTRRTDDVIWLWAIRDLFENNEHIADWEWLYDTAKKCFALFYDPFYDSSDGLYKGQATFIDVHFENVKTTGYPQSYSIDDCVSIKSLSTNCLYYEGLKTMAVVCGKLNKSTEKEEWERRANNLKNSILENLQFTDGTFSYYKGKDGNKSPRRDALGTALAVITGIVTGDTAIKCIKGYPISWAGIPLFHPFYPSRAVYHNNTSWPFVDTFFLWAQEIALKENFTDLNIALLARTCIGDGSFHEYVNLYTKEPSGSGSQLWSAAAFVNTCIRAGLLN